MRPLFARNAAAHARNSIGQFLRCIASNDNNRCFEIGSAMRKRVRCADCLSCLLAALCVGAAFACCYSRVTLVTASSQFLTLSRPGLRCSLINVPGYGDDNGVVARLTTQEAILKSVHMHILCSFRISNRTVHTYMYVYVHACT